MFFIPYACRTTLSPTFKFRTFLVRTFLRLPPNLSISKLPDVRTGLARDRADPEAWCRDPGLRVRTRVAETRRPDLRQVFKPSGKQIETLNPKNPNQLIFKSKQLFIAIVKRTRNV